MYCPNCNSEVLTEVKTVSETYPVKGEEITVTAKVRCCKNCGQSIWDEELDGQNLLDAFAIYRQRHGLLQPEEIRRIREKYGLSQVAFAKVLGLGNKTVARYENGSIADMAQNLRNTRNNLQQSHHRQIRNVKQRLQPFPFHGIAADAEKFDFAAGLFFQRPHQA